MLLREPGQFSGAYFVHVFADELRAGVELKVGPRKDERGVNLISDALAFGPALVWRAECNQ